MKFALCDVISVNGSYAW